MDAQRYNPVVRKTLQVYIPSVSKLDDDNAEWLDPLPSPPPPTPSHARRGVSYDMQRFDPFRVMMAASTPHFTSPTSPEFAIDYPKLPDSLTFRFPTTDGVEDCDRSSEPQWSEVDDLFADSEDVSPDSSFEISTPVELCDDFGTTFHFEGAEEQGEYEIDRTILRPTGRHNSKFDFSGSLAKLATRSTATLRTMASFSRSAGSASASASGDSDSEDAYGGIAAPPASVLASRRPSIAPGASNGSMTLSSPVSAAEVVKSLRRLASSLTLDCAGHAAERHFEEAVDHYEKTWSLDDTIEVHVDRTEAVSYQDRDECSDFDYDFGFPARPDGIGLYARA